jgi:hypothetical protein
VPFADEETWYQGAEKYFVEDPLPFSPVAFAQALFPDFGHFDRQHHGRYCSTSLSQAEATSCRSRSFCWELVLAGVRTILLQA